MFGVEDDFNDRIDRLELEIEHYKQWIADLQSGQYVNCVYCGHRYGPGETTPVTMADALKEHVEQCSKHPMSALKKENEAMKEEIQEYEKILERYQTNFGIRLKLHE